MQTDAPLLLSVIACEPPPVERPVSSQPVPDVPPQGHYEYWETASKQAPQSQKWWWRFRHFNGQIIGRSSEGYTDRRDCIAGIRLLQMSAKSLILDATGTPQPPTEVDVKAREERRLKAVAEHKAKRAAREKQQA